MKKRLFALFAFVLLFAFISPIQAFALGGFVSPSGSDTYHEIYCFMVDGYNLDELQWFDTAKQAETAGLTPCSECNAANGLEFIYDLETNWKTDNHLIHSAMEIESEIAYWNGHKEGYNEGVQDTQSAYEDWQYESADYADGYEDGIDHGYDQGLDDGYDSGKRAAEETIRIELEAKYEEKLESAKRSSLWIGVAIGGIVVYAVCSLQKKKGIA